MYIRVNFKRMEGWIVTDNIYKNINGFIDGYISE